VRRAKALRERLNAIVTAKCPVAGPKGKGSVWVAPNFKADVAYRGLTMAGELRHASFKGLVE
jgi:bifunctional non-homologous end joining protein LigD